MAMSGTIAKSKNGQKAGEGILVCCNIPETKHNSCMKSKGKASILSLVVWRPLS